MVAADPLTCINLKLSLGKLLALKVAEFQVANLEGASISYAAPEALLRYNKRQIMALSGDKKVAGDVYSLGIVFYALLCCKLKIWTV